MLESNEEHEDRMNRISEFMIGLVNRVVNEEDPTDRVGLAKEMSNGLGSLLACPVVALEQLIHKLELEQEYWAKKANSDLGQLPKVIRAVVEDMMPVAKAKEKKILATLKAFLKVRPVFVDALEELLGQRINVDGRWEPKKEAL